MSIYNSKVVATVTKFVKLFCGVTRSVSSVPLVHFGAHTPFLLASDPQEVQPAMPQQFPFSGSWNQGSAGPPPGMMQQNLPRPPRLMGAGPQQQQPMMMSSQPSMPQQQQQYSMMGPRTTSFPPGQQMQQMQRGPSNNSAAQYQQMSSGRQQIPFDNSGMPPGEQVPPLRPHRTALSHDLSHRLSPPVIIGEFLTATLCLMTRNGVPG